MILRRFPNYLCMRMASVSSIGYLMVFDIRYFQLNDPLLEIKRHGWPWGIFQTSIAEFPSPPACFTRRIN